MPFLLFQAQILKIYVYIVNHPHKVFDSLVEKKINMGDRFSSV